MIAAPLDGARKLTVAWPLPAVTDVMVGAPGTEASVLNVFDWTALWLPAASTRTMKRSYVVPAARPDTVSSPMLPPGSTPLPLATTVTAP